jgi:hypothetical protein
MSEKSSRKTTQKVLLSITALAAAAGLAGVGTYASFTGSAAATQNISTGKMQITLGAPGPNRLALAATGMVPADTMQRAVDLNVPLATNTAGTMTGVTLTTTDSTPTVLSTDAVRGLFIKIDRCSAVGGWTEAGVSPAFTYTCAAPGVITSVLARVPVVGAARTLNALALAPGSVNNLVVTIDLDAAAIDTFQGLSATIQHTFNGVQRANAPQ